MNFNKVKKPAFAVMTTAALLGSSFGLTGDTVKASIEVKNQIEETNLEELEVNNVEVDSEVEEKAVKADIEIKEKVEFRDVTEDSFAYEAIIYLAGEGIIRGYGNGLFGLKDNVTRGQVSALIARYLKLDLDKKFSNPYGDVKGNQFESEILAVTDAGYMQGKGSERFDPKATLTRAEMAQVLTNVFDLKVKNEYDFWDMDEKHWATNAVRALYSNGLTLGMGDNLYKPEGTVTREQYAEFLYRGIFLNEEYEADPIPPKEDEKEDEDEVEPTPPKDDEKDDNEEKKEKEDEQKDDKNDGDKPDDSGDGMPDYTNADGEMTRVGLARLIVENIDPDVTASNVSFSDIKEGSYTEEFVQKAVALGFIDPANYNNEFEAETAVDRAEVSTWMVNAMAENNSEYANAINELKSDLTLLPVTEHLKGDIVEEDVPYVGIALGTGLFEGYADHSFRPDRTITKPGTETIIDRYEDILTKSSKSFSDLNEFREVATTGTNILTVTPYEKFVNNQGVTSGGFEDILGKKIDQANGTGVSTIERVIVVNTTTNNIKGAYKDMFVGKEDERFAGRGIYDFFMEFTHIPSRDISPMQWADGSTSIYTSGLSANHEKGVEFGYNTPSRNNGDNVNLGQFFKTGEKNRFWMHNGAESEPNDSVRLTVDDGSSVYYIHP